MGIERFTWLNDAIKAHQNITFPSSSIIEGEFGLAKKQLARYFAQKLLCSDDSAPCGICNSCNYFLAWSHPDYCFLDKDSCSSALHGYSKAKKDSLTSNNIDGIRALNEFIAMTNSVSKKRIAIVFDAHSMGINAQNAILKTLEELPENKHILDRKSVV